MHFCSECGNMLYIKVSTTEEKNLIYYYSSGECMFSKSPCSNYRIQNLKLENKNGYKLIIHIFYILGL